MSPIGLMIYFLASGCDNPFFARCHQPLLQLWNADGGKTSTEGMHGSILLKGAPLMEWASMIGVNRMLRITSFKDR